MELNPKASAPLNERKSEVLYYTEDDKEFMRKNAELLYKTSGKTIGSQAILIKPEEKHGIDGNFTDHLLHAGMYRNNGLNTILPKERWMNGSKDWVGHLN